MARLFVVGQVVAHHASHVEVVGQLEVEHWVVNLPCPHLLDIFLRAHLVGILMIVWYSPAKHYGL